MADNGWIKFYKKTFENPVVMKDADHLAIWTWLLLKAAWKESDVWFDGKRVTLMPGDLPPISRNTIASELHISDSKVQRVLKTFEIEQQIEQQMSNKNRLISIVAWDEYQNGEQQTEQQVNSNRTASEQQVNTIEEYKTINNNNNRQIENEFTELWELYPKKAGKKDALRHYKASRKRGTSYDQVKQGILAYKNYIEKTGTDMQYVKQGSSFFNQEAWESDWTVPEQKQKPKTNVPIQPEPPSYKPFEPEPERKVEPMTEEQRRNRERILQGVSQIGGTA